MRYPVSRRTFLIQTAVAAGGAIVLSACTPDSPNPAPTQGGSGLPPLEGGTLVTDPASMPTRFGESPEFAAMVKAGTLPPVAQRIGQDPLVLKPVHGIGKYGGVIHRGYLGASDYQNANRFCAGPDNLLYWDFKKEHVIPNIARGYDMSSDGKELVLHLRRGMRWSDGHPFTADDIMFWRDDINLNENLTEPSSVLQLRDGTVRIEKIDEVTVRFVSPVPFFLLPSHLAGWNDLAGQSQRGRQGGGGFAPRHYLSQFLPKYIGEAQATKLASAAGFPTWQAHVNFRSNWSLNVDLPVLTPWKSVRQISDPPWDFEANPYSIWVDNEGNQLPYIPKISMAQTGDADVLNLKAISGEFDFQDRSLSLPSLPVLLKNQESGKYTIHRTPGTGSDYGFGINLSYEKDPVIGDLLRNVDFRRALSLGVDRDAINQTFFLGTSTPTAALCSDTSPYFPGSEWRNKWATLDVAQANQLLDKIGLTKKDADGWRLRPDGNGIIKLETTGTDVFADGNAINEMIKRQYRAIGIYLEIFVNVSDERILANEEVLIGMGVGTDDLFLIPDGVLLTTDGPSGGQAGILYAKWYLSGGKDGKPLPDSLSPMRDIMDKYYRGLTAPDAERIRLGKEIMQTYVDQVYSIGMVGYGLSLYGFFLAKNNLKNVPARIISGEAQKSPSNALPMTFYYE